MHQSSMEAMADFVQEFLEPWRGKPLNVLDVGSMDVNGSYRVLFDDPAWQYTGVDAEAGMGVDLVLTRAYRWNRLESAEFDVVISGQAFEHIEFPWVSMLEVARVMKPGALLCVLVPSGGYEHRYPLDCWRYYPDGIAALARWADLDVLSARTNWTPRQDYRDDSALWQDTILVARKRNDKATQLNRMKTLALRLVMRLQAERRGALRG